MKFRILDKALKQNAIYWARDPDHPVDDFGQPRYDDPVGLRCRWEDTTEEFIDAQGEKKVSRARVLVREDVVPGGLLLLGDVDDLASDADPVELAALEIQSFQKNPTADGKDFLRTVML